MKSKYFITTSSCIFSKEPSIVYFHGEVTPAWAFYHDTARNETFFDKNRFFQLKPAEGFEIFNITFYLNSSRRKKNNICVSFH